MFVTWSEGCATTIMGEVVICVIGFEIGDLDRTGSLSVTVAGNIAWLVMLCTIKV